MTDNIRLYGEFWGSARDYVQLARNQMSEVEDDVLMILFSDIKDKYCYWFLDHNVYTLYAYYKAYGNFDSKNKYIRNFDIITFDNFYGLGFLQMKGFFKILSKDYKNAKPSKPPLDFHPDDIGYAKERAEIYDGLIENDYAIRRLVDEIDIKARYEWEKERSHNNSINTILLKKIGINKTRGVERPSAVHFDSNWKKIFQIKEH